MTIQIDPSRDPSGETTDDGKDIVDIFDRPEARTEIISFEDWRALSGVDELTARRAWSLAESWLFKANRHPRLEELRFALHESQQPSTAEALRQRGYTLNGD